MSKKEVNTSIYKTLTAKPRCTMRKLLAGAEAVCAYPLPPEARE